MQRPTVGYGRLLLVLIVNFLLVVAMTQQSGYGMSQTVGAFKRCRDTLAKFSQLPLVQMVKPSSVAVTIKRFDSGIFCILNATKYYMDIRTGYYPLPSVRIVRP